MTPSLTRRHALAAALGAATVSVSSAARAAETGRVAVKGRVKHSVMAWCFKLPPAELIAACADMGLSAMEGIGREHYPAILAAGMKVSLVGSHGFAKGPVNPANIDACVKSLVEGIDVAVANGCDKVITFTGMREADIADAAAKDNCVACWKQVIAHAEAKGVTLCLEHLNSRDGSGPMLGHPGYFGDTLDTCMELIRRIDSPRFKLLFDIYHVQIMHGDVIRRIRELKDVIAHVHTAGVPGRAELDEKQEINYPAVIRALLDTGYAGYISHEFIPAGADKIAALRHGVAVCDV